MMTLDQQIQTLLQEAPQDGVTPKLVQILAPLFRQLASELQHLEYFIPQSMDDRWLVTTLSNRAQPDRQKQVVYAFCTLGDVQVDRSQDEALALVARPVPIVQILFQLLALKTVDSVIVLDTPGHPEQGIEIEREHLNGMVQAYLRQQLQGPPPDIA